MEEYIHVTVLEHAGKETLWETKFSGYAVVDGAYYSLNQIRLGVTEGLDEGAQEIDCARLYLTDGAWRDEDLRQPRFAGVNRRYALDPHGYEPPASMRALRTCVQGFHPEGYVLISS